MGYFYIYNELHFHDFILLQYLQVVECIMTMAISPLRVTGPINNTKDYLQARL
jgi:hypothetical protein